MKKIFATLTFILISSFILGQETEKPIKIPPFIIFNKYTNKESYKLIRWVTWSEDQKQKIFLFTQNFGKKELEIPEEIAKQVQVIKDALKSEEEKKGFNEKRNIDDLTSAAMEKHFAEAIPKIHMFIELLKTDAQKIEFKEKCENAELAKVAIEKNLTEFATKTKALKGKPIDQDFFDILNATRFFYFPEIWAITQTPLNNDEKNKVMLLISHLKQIEEGFFLASEKSQNDLNKDFNYFDFNLKKDFGTEALNKEINSFSKANQEIYLNLLAHYQNQKKSLLEIYKKYGEKNKFEIYIAPPKIIDEPPAKPSK